MLTMLIILYFNIKVYSLHYLVDTDIASNKPAYSSSAFNDNTASYGPQYVNNGQAVCDNAEGPIAHTNNQQQPWFKIDLKGTYYIKTVIVNPRTSKFIITNQSSKMINLSFSFIQLELNLLNCD